MFSVFTLAHDIFPYAAGLIDFEYYFSYARVCHRWNKSATVCLQRLPSEIVDDIRTYARLKRTRRRGTWTEAFRTASLAHMRLAIDATYQDACEILSPQQAETSVEVEFREFFRKTPLPQSRNSGRFLLALRKWAPFPTIETDYQEDDWIFELWVYQVAQIVSGTTPDSFLGDWPHHHIESLAACSEFFFFSEPWVMQISEAALLSRTFELVWAIFPGSDLWDFEGQLEGKQITEQMEYDHDAPSLFAIICRASKNDPSFLRRLVSPSGVQGIFFPGKQYSAIVFEILLSGHAQMVEFLLEGATRTDDEIVSACDDPSGEFRALLQEFRSSGKRRQ